ncbi:MAG: hypothetical protein RBS76_00940 [Acholeplasmatales bacterium]|jgi:hypothetical protein|nr:hypothetical protein [Acholeplasmataceae bacterium]MDY0115045.1 hypothetical protein [Acholeplasmatales bacterium]MCK9233860.1 hypothetical protein [Acholeplasmataceae bacterium]MCK9289371.1 hypothetical protein [Acholeplasmataceae bacterium]MCK9428080.1 hypothetical protein [Acholeplasmataceae bacterium]
MKKTDQKPLFIGVFGAVMLIINIFVFLKIGNQLEKIESDDKITIYMYYLAFILIIAAFVVVLISYLLRYHSNNKKIRIIISICFYFSLLIFIMFMATWIFVLRSG